jgi:telomerase reverse transcriptase
MEQLSEFQNSNSILLRFVDDFLFISTRKDVAASFLAKFINGKASFFEYSGFPKYRCFINPEKTLINFQDDLLNSQPISSREFPWCGLLINTHDLSVMSDYSSIQKQGGTILLE